MQLTNGEKNKHGLNAQDSLEELLIFCRNQGFISAYSKSFRIGKPGFENDEQFYCAFLITFKTSEKWALFSTTSMRTDRIKGQQWDVFNIKLLKPEITKGILVYPDDISEKDKQDFIRQNQKYVDGYEFSAIDYIVSQNELSNLIESNACSELTPGQIKDKQGRSFEEKVAVVLSNYNNFKKWKSKSEIAIGIHYNMFERIISEFGLTPDNVYKILATTTIKKLPNGGSPKTDVLVKVFYNNDDVKNFTISCKRSSENSVSVHQYNADAFTNVLDKNNQNLRHLLNGFQEAGNSRDFGESNCNALTEELSHYRLKLILWVLGGIGGEGDPDTQWANFFLTYNNNDDSFRIHSIEEYSNLLLDNSVGGNFGTPFSWTYPSKQRGKYIQLKCKIL